MPWPETALLPVARTDASAALLPSLLPLTGSPCTVHRRKLGKFAPNAACAGLVQLSSALPRLRAFCAWSEPADSAVWGDHVAGLQSSCIRSLRCPPPGRIFDLPSGAVAASSQHSTTPPIASCAASPTRAARGTYTWWQPGCLQARHATHRSASPANRAHETPACAALMRTTQPRLQLLPSVTRSVIAHLSLEISSLAAIAIPAAPHSRQQSCSSLPNRVPIA